MASRVCVEHDVIIIGAGFAGLMCADRLSRLGFSTVVVDRAPQTLAGTSSRNEGWLHAGTYHAQSIADPTEAIAVARRCRYGWNEIRRRFPECVEPEPHQAVAIVPADRVEPAVGRWRWPGSATASSTIGANRRSCRTCASARTKQFSRSTT
jgi:glycine/D-amino acid oxidase-like deaminating enzyme